MSNQILEIAHHGWSTDFPAETQAAATSALEDGAVVMLPGLTFDLSEAEGKLLDPAKSPLHILERLTGRALV